jgi:hypothetical protein
MSLPAAAQIKPIDFDNRIPAIVAVWRLNQLLDRLGLQHTFGLKSSKDYVEKYLSREAAATPTATFSIGVIEGEADAVQTITMVEL